MAKVIHAPSSIKNIKKMSIFLAGTIDQGKSFDWQKAMAKEWDKFDIVLLNPRRPDWDSKAKSKEIKEQINWELEAMDKADIIVLNIIEDSESPISIAEAYRHAGDSKLFVCCPKGFYRYENVKAVCDYYGSAVYNSWEDLTKDFNKNMKPLIEAWEFTNNS